MIFFPNYPCIIIHRGANDPHQIKHFVNRAKLDIILCAVKLKLELAEPRKMRLEFDSAKKFLCLSLAQWSSICVSSTNQLEFGLTHFSSFRTGTASLKFKPMYNPIQNPITNTQYLQPNLRNPQSNNEFKTTN